MADNDLCKKCRIEMKFLREEVIADTKYKILKCEKCKHQVARAES
jgi:hypothetical protein|tara:strand:- start:357 stop:491 length:135 start_codon:yes stop_codon:yes gene_type:complete